MLMDVECAAELLASLSRTIWIGEGCEVTEICDELSFVTP